MLRLDPEAEASRVVDAIRRQVRDELKRRGAVLGLSGGIDSSVCAALCVRALGPSRVLGLLMPERDSSGESATLARKLAGALGIETVLEDIGAILDAAGCYRRRNEAIRSVVPEYGEGWKEKLVIAADAAAYAIFYLVVQSPQGVQRKVRLTREAYLGVVAAMNFKQRTRKMMEYYHADRLVYAVVGTPNRLEYDQGFFVKGGDGAADLKPIAHLYKSQVYQLAEYLGIPDEIRSRPPTTDTYSLAQSQEEFYFSVPYQQMDLCLYGRDHGLPAQEIAAAARMSASQVERVYLDIDSKRRATRYLHLPPLLVPSAEEKA